MALENYIGCATRSTTPRSCCSDGSNSRCRNGTGPLRAALRDGQLHAHPYSVALHRSEVQREILENATRGLDALDGVDWAAVDADVLAKLDPCRSAHSGVNFDAILPVAP